MSTPNADALATARRDLVGIVARLAESPWLTDTLARWGDEAQHVADQLDAFREADQLRTQSSKGIQATAAQEIVEVLASLPEAPDSTTGLSLLASATNRLPQEVGRDRRRALRIPAVLTQAASGYGRESDVLPRLAGRIVGSSVQYSLLPQLGPEYDEYGGEFLASALPVELYQTPGRGAPLDIRLGLNAILDVSPEQRRGVPVSLKTTSWGFVVKRIYPKTKHYRATNLWPGLARAIQKLKTDPRWDLPVSNGKGGWELVRVVTVPRHPMTGHKSERVSFVVTLPQASKRGGVTARDILNESGAKSSAALALASGLPIIWDRPGSLRVPGADGRYLQNADPSAYPPLTLRGVVSLMYPGGPPKRKRWRQLLDEARRLLDWLADRGYARWDRTSGGKRRIMPGANWPGWTIAQRAEIRALGPPR